MTLLRFAALFVVVLSVAAGCARDSATATAPTSVAAIPATPGGGNGGGGGGGEAFTPTFPEVTKPARIFRGTLTPVWSIHNGPLHSRYVLYDDRSFALQYSSPAYPFFEYRGNYTETNGILTFTWEGWSTAGPWGATGTLEGELLKVSYNLVMQMSDFLDDTYVRVR